MHTKKFEQCDYEDEGGFRCQETAKHRYHDSELFCEHHYNTVGRQQNYFGACPTCHKNDGYANVGRTHILFCIGHRVRWTAGENIFSSWKYETEEEQRSNYDAIGLDSFTEVEPYYFPDCRDLPFPGPEDPKSVAVSVTTFEEDFDAIKSHDSATCNDPNCVACRTFDCTDAEQQTNDN